MYNPYNPYFNNFKDSQPQQPIQNIINTQIPLNNLFMAQFLKKDEKVEEMFVNHKTAFIDLFKKELKIKDIDGAITTYGLILPKDEKDEKIEELEKQISELKGMITNEYSKHNRAVESVNEPSTNDIVDDDTSTKTTIRGTKK